MALNFDHIRQLLDEIADTEDDLSAQKADELLSYITREKAAHSTASLERTERHPTQQGSVISASSEASLAVLDPLGV